jgi:hypothetical protein
MARSGATAGQHSGHDALPGVARASSGIGNHRQKIMVADGGNASLVDEARSAG